MITDYEIKEIEELAYRRGVAHGFTAGINIKGDQIEEVMKKINKWKIDLEDMTGIPGTMFEKIKMDWRPQKQE